MERKQHPEMNCPWMRFVVQALACLRPARTSEMGTARSLAGVRRKSRLFRLLPLLLFAAALNATAALRTLDATSYHLRSGSAPEWQQFAASVPHGRRLDIRFTAKTN